MGLNYICSWMYAEIKEEKGIYPQLGGMSSATASAQAIYWRCTVVFFETAIRALKDRSSTRLLLFTNLQKLPIVDEIDLNDLFSRMNVEIVTLAYTWHPKGKSKLWFNQFYFFDIIDYLNGIVNSSDNVVIADSDCVFVRDPSRLFDVVRRDGVLLITVDENLGPDADINGLSRRQAIDVFEQLSGRRPASPPLYYGGECYGLTANTLAQVKAMAPTVKLVNDALAESGAPHLSDEAHFYSFLMWKLGYQQANGNGYVRRIWTTWKHYTSDADDLALTVWHLPSEKRFGFRLVFDSLQSWPRFWSEAESRSWLGKQMGVGRRSPRKFVDHLAFAVRRRFSFPD